MTNQERAEKIAQVIEKRIPSNAIEIPGAAMALRVYIEGQLDEAVREAEDRGYQDGLRFGWNNAREKAVVLAEDHFEKCQISGCCAYALGESIRATVP